MRNSFSGTVSLTLITSIGIAQSALAGVSSDFLVVSVIPMKQVLIAGAAANSSRIAGRWESDWGTVVFNNDLTGFWK